MTRPFLSVIVPVYNEERTVEKALQRVLEATASFDREIVVVDDGSTDGTPTILQAFARYPRVQIHRQEVNQGKGAALRKGFERATGEVILIQDADLEQDPSDYGVLLRPFIEESADVVYGTRFSGRRHRNFSLPYIANRVIVLWASLLYGVRITDLETGYKAFRRRVVERLKLTSNKFDIEVELTAKFIRSGHRIREVPVRYNPRGVSAGKKIRWTDGLLALYFLVKYRILPRGSFVRGM